MDFARAQLEKYGWKDGEGLGKNKTGISTAIKPKLKSDKSGLGHNPGDEYTFNWWEHSFNAAANRISVSHNKDGVKVKTKRNSKPLEISTKRPGTFLNEGEKKKLTYGRFKMTMRLVGDGEEERLEPDVQPEESPAVVVEQLTDEQLFLACEGRTAHKGARHGLGLSGKLARVEQQDQSHLLSQHTSEASNKCRSIRQECDKQLKNRKKKKKY